MPDNSPVSRPEPDLMALGRLVRTRRLELGLSQTEFGRRFGWLQERVSLVESGRYGMPSLQSLAQLALALEVSLADLLHAAGFGETLGTPDADSHG